MEEIIFLWSWRNVEHIGKHGVEPDEAEYVVKDAKRPYPEATGDEKWAVWGATAAGRLLQVIFVRVRIEGVEADEFQQLEWHERAALEDGEAAVRIIHARDLTDSEKRRLRRRKRRS
ncbi:MAG TPA: hypothetical protein VGR35_16605 [Tepidisphaeraceae bacterium]|nr:hypothetical protein [Tepidisphaeraceae bacterium]